MNAMTVKELRDLLKDFDDEMPVHFAYNSGDYWKTEITQRTSEVEERYVRWSEYHRTWRLVDDVEMSDGNEELALEDNLVVVIS